MLVLLMLVSLPVFSQVDNISASSSTAVPTSEAPIANDFSSSKQLNKPNPVLLKSRALFQPREKAELSSEIAARVIDLPFRAGEAFKKGDLLVQFDCRVLNARVVIARAQLKAALKTLENKRHLKALNSVAEIEVELATAEHEKSKGELALALYQREYCKIMAPFSGRLVDSVVNEHETISPGDPLVQILNDTSLEIASVVPSVWLSWLRPGHTFKVKVDETGKQYSGTIVQLGAAIDPVSQTISIIGQLDHAIRSGEILSGMSGTAIFEKNVNPRTP